MKKEQIIVELKSRCKTLMNESNEKKYILIKDILDEENCFDKIDVETAMNILLDLKYDEKTAYSMFEILVGK